MFTQRESTGLRIASLVTFRKRKHRLASGKKRPKPDQQLEHAEQA